MKKLVMLMMTLALAVVMAACNGDSEDNNNEEGSGEGQSEQASQQQQQMPEPDLEGIPDVVAEVNGEEISGEEFKTTYEGQFQQMAMQSQMSGQELNQDELKQQTAEGMVSSELLIQEAGNRNFEASDKEVDEKLTELAQQSGMESKDKFISALEEQGMKQEDINSQVKTQVKVDKLIADESGDTKPSEEELQQAYDQFKSQREQMSQGSEGGEQAEIPSFDEMKSDLESQVKKQKEAEAAQTIIDKLREDADVTINL
ncbi:SurA N-terminal domain-containing protein [Lentibacillus amyloliquefaciens]|uniref:peptidylprolyl isomerase n=1 Tax=Lentibacillus amyloliquefaciens TaxID=1472767 RepID=A0A0U4FTM1_9BACI|nr:SurA N-terminal domain-containing protein [Lentibacillus amyloliquefaciens]ALX49205.1 peptidylprolyl isomerase [Lentibacillus amyloliquefaciens]